MFGGTKMNRKTKRKIRLKSRGKNLFVICSIILLLSFYLNLTGLFEKQAFGRTDTYNTVVVKKGDTLWGLAEKYGPKQDIRKTVYEIKMINNITDKYLKPGELLIIP
jgi:nucleoid-associated protein YgaU